MQTLCIKNGFPLLDGKPVEGLISYFLSVDREGNTIFSPKIMVQLGETDSRFDGCANNLYCNTGEGRQ